MAVTLVDKVVDFHREKDWRRILDLREQFSNEDTRKILWAWPSEENLLFLREALISEHMEGVVSIGCGCGLLEWILQQYTGLSVVGIEVNRPWWESKYSNPSFIPLTYIDDQEDVNLNPSYALLFCYFNSGPDFRQYVKQYSGKMIIIIGPDEGSGRHTDPQPFSPEFGSSDWHLVRSQQVKDTGDFIAVYQRSHVTI
ncbi:hypothetical protein GWI33_016474 [Rhynchophorus ferrugineus]|uniref:Uncharacterized protein n=1 Tax=Rhynchophorus ferrugineus TaxID=354439 RepID=A0A834M4Z0_RHYFE|nr:hypothetical protein GWI33_016474 [Rhynchophorus ferrugineus]